MVDWGDLLRPNKTVASAGHLCPGGDNPQSLRINIVSHPNKLVPRRMQSSFVENKYSQSFNICLVINTTQTRHQHPLLQERPAHVRRADRAAVVVRGKPNRSAVQPSDDPRSATVGVRRRRQSSPGGWGGRDRPGRRLSQTLRAVDFAQSAVCEREFSQQSVGVDFEVKFRFNKCSLKWLNTKLIVFVCLQNCRPDGAESRRRGARRIRFRRGRHCAGVHSGAPNDVDAIIVN